MKYDTKPIEKTMDNAINKLEKLLLSNVRQSAFFIESRTYIEDREVWQAETGDLETMENALAHKEQFYHSDDVRIVEVHFAQRTRLCAVRDLTDKT